eukprot:6222730-Prymnesium_polylepis.1
MPRAGRREDDRQGDRQGRPTRASDMASAFSAGDEVRITALLSRQDLNGRTGTLTAWDAKLNRWKVRVEGLPKLLALHATNLQSPEVGGGANDAGPPEIVSAKVPGKRARIGYIVERRPAEGSVLVEFESAPKESAWVPEDAAPALPVAPEETVPTEY